MSSNYVNQYLYEKIFIKKPLRSYFSKLWINYFEETCLILKGKCKAITFLKTMNQNSEPMLP